MKTLLNDKRMKTVIKYLFIYFLLFTISVTAGESGDEKNNLNKQKNNLTKEEKKFEDPFSRDLLKELAYRQNLSLISFYSLDSLKLVATLQLPVNNQSLQRLRKKIFRTWGDTDESEIDINEDEELKLDDFSQNLESISNRLVKSLAVVQLPESEDQIILYEGQQVGGNKGVLKSINKSDILFIENNKEIILEISK